MGEGWTSLVKRNAENVESTQGESNESTDKGNKQSSSSHGFARITRKYDIALKDAVQGVSVGVREEETSAIRPNVVGLGGTKECFAFVNDASAGTIYLTLVNLAGGAKFAE